MDPSLYIAQYDESPTGDLRATFYIGSFLIFLIKETNGMKVKYPGTVKPTLRCFI